MRGRRVAWWAPRQSGGCGDGVGWRGAASERWHPACDLEQGPSSPWASLSSSTGQGQAGGPGAPQTDPRGWGGHGAGDDSEPVLAVIVQADALGGAPDTLCLTRGPSPSEFCPRAASETFASVESRKHWISMPSGANATLVREGALRLVSQEPRSRGLGGYGHRRMHSVPFEGQVLPGTEPLTLRPRAVGLAWLPVRPWGCFSK